MSTPTKSLAIAAVFLLSALPAFAEGPFSDLSFEAALKAAEKDKKIVVIDFYTTWCGPCKMLDKSTWKDEQVLKWFKDKAVALKIDADKEKMLAMRFKISSYPTIVLLKADGKEIDRLTGYRDAKAFLSDVGSALEGNDSLSRAKAAVDEAPEDPMVKKQYAHELAERGRYEDALREYLWCFDEGVKHLPSFSGVRISFLLGEIAQLGENYPPALEALRERRDRGEKKVLAYFKEHAKDGPPAGKQKGVNRLRMGNPRSAAMNELREYACDSAYINQNLGEPERALQFYDKLRDIGDAAKPLRGRMLFMLFDDLVEARRYREIIEDGGNPVDETDQDLAMWEVEKLHYKNDKVRGKEMEEMRRGYLLKKIAQNYEVLVGAGEFDDADAVAKKVLEFEKSAKSYSALIRSAARARSPELARELHREAEKALSKGERDELVPLDEMESAAEGAKPATP